MGTCAVSMHVLRTVLKSEGEGGKRVLSADPTFLEMGPKLKITHLKESNSGLSDLFYLEYSADIVNMKCVVVAAAAVLERHLLLSVSHD